MKKEKKTMKEKFKKYSVEWSLNQGQDIDWEEFSTLREAKAYIKKHLNDPEKEDLHIKVWDRWEIGERGDDYEWEVIDTIELCEIGLFKEGK